MKQPSVSFRIHGLDCAEEVTILKREIGSLVGGEDNLVFDIMSGKMTLTAAANNVPVHELLSRIGATGMRAEIWREEAGRAESWWERHSRATLTISSGLSVAAGVIVHAVLVGGFTRAFGSEGVGIHHEVPLAARTIYVLAILCGVRFVLPKAWFALRRLRPDMNLLMTVAVVGAVLIGEWFEAATVSFLFALSLTLESWSVGRARKAVESLLSLTPPTVRLVEAAAQFREVAPETVAIGARFLVKPGERIPLDGEVVSGNSQVNQAPITGESIPVEKTASDPVYAGTVNGSGALEVRSTKPAGDTTLAHIIRMVGEAHQRRAPSERWVDRFARIYTPSVMVLAICVLLVPPMFLQQPFSDWIYRSLVLLVIACPCALVISTPVSVVAALAAAAKNGVLIKGGQFVEAPVRLKALAFDKTGTLTEGRLSVAEVVPIGEHSEARIVEVAAALESQSDHPLAAAILEYARKEDAKRLEVKNLQNIAGKGVTAEIGGASYWVGSHRYLEERAQETEEIHNLLVNKAHEGRTVVIVGSDHQVMGLLALADRVRPNAARAIADLRACGVEHVLMVTGDNRATAEAIARATGITEFQAELLPSDKVLFIESLIERYETVGMVGDGINDAPAMGRASIGIAMGAIGSDTAIETADIALMSDDLSKLPWLIRHSRRTLAIIRQNIVASLAVKAVFVILTLLGHASLWAAIAADMGVSLLVIFNALRLLHQQTP
ncbi:MAG TPA: heavy metal translocating P-type ATPase [Terriglobales bacterium]|nr:heavy metal translocating P-type ATPase [Terriglobales bacterium]